MHQNGMFSFHNGKPAPTSHYRRPGLPGFVFCFFNYDVHRSKFKKNIHVNVLSRSDYQDAVPPAVSKWALQSHFPCDAQNRENPKSLEDTRSVQEAWEQEYNKLTKTAGNTCVDLETEFSRWLTRHRCNSRGRSKARNTASDEARFDSRLKELKQRLMTVSWGVSVTCCHEGSEGL